MILCLDVGNTQIYGGVFSGDDIQLRFRHDSRYPVSSDQLGIFLRGVLHENNLSANDISGVAICSVVPNMDYTVGSACRKYFDLEPFFLQAGVRTGLQIKYRNPIEVGADRIANAVAAMQSFPNKNMIIIDFGTATTFCVINRKKEYLGGVIIAGMRLSMDALQSNTAKLSPVSIVKPKNVTGRSTMESIQSGLYYTQLAALKTICKKIEEENFDEPPILIGTGGFAYLFESEGIFTAIIPDLVLHGLRLLLEMN